MKHLIYILFGLFLSSCCSNLYYANDPVVFANVTEKSDFNLAGGLNFGRLTKGINFHGSTAFSRKFFVTGSFTNYSGDCTTVSSVDGVTTDSKVRYAGNSFLFGIGYYKPIKNNFYFEGSIGGKYGNNSNTGADESFEYRHIKYFYSPELPIREIVFKLD